MESKNSKINKTPSYIEKLEDFELAFLSVFRLKEYLPDTQFNIQKEIINRQLTDHKMNQLMANKIKENFNSDNQNIQCTYCKSYHHHSITIEQTEDRLSNIFDIFGANRPIKYTTLKTCSICGKSYSEDVTEFIKILNQ